jgi:hypothetical protein
MFSTFDDPVDVLLPTSFAGALAPPLAGAHATIDSAGKTVTSSASTRLGMPRADSQRIRIPFTFPGNLLFLTKAARAQRLTIAGIQRSQLP